ncbi:hypothetical protein GQ53DRAFT_755531 [Thozetella sp. PMI_491]|nr:hypothetical protein GQ53DRAFT_755531 [Thozetella sp. PMI_491]
MGKKRKVPRSSEPSGPRAVDPKDASLRIRSFEDVADSEDEYHMAQDRIDFDDEPRSKRARRKEREEEFLDVSDEEVLAEGDSDDEEQDAAPSKKPKADAEQWEDEEEQEGEGDEGFWGSSKKDYYNADQIETEADAFEEEQEARRIQVKKLAKMSEADFMFDEADWLATDAGKDTEKEDVVTEVLKEAEITDDMGPGERQKLLKARHPEFELLVDEFRELHPLVEEYKKGAEGKPARSLAVVKYWVVGSYVAALASYFAILTSPARDTEGSSSTIDPADLRDHEIMSTLMDCREAWLRVKKLRPAKSEDLGMLSPPEEDDIEELEVPVPKMARESAETKAAKKAAKKAAAEKAKRAKAVEESLADLSSLLSHPKKVKSSKSKDKAEVEEGAASDDDNGLSDFGEEDALDARVAADKAKRKKSLRFYTSQIVQKANRRAEAGRDAGGDNDIPYRERLRDRQARLNAEAERRGQKGTKDGADLGGDDDESNDEDAALANRMRDDEDEEYYDMVAHSAKRKKEDKAARHEALARAGREGRVVEEETVGEDGKRRITYSISKNKGLTPMRRRKDKGSSNPRLKKRLAYQSKQVKQKSMRAVYSGGESKGGYQGETSGIKTGLIKSVKLS